MMMMMIGADFGPVGVSFFVGKVCFPADLLLSYKESRGEVYE